MSRTAYHWLPHQAVTACGTLKLRLLRWNLFRRRDKGVLRRQNWKTGGWAQDSLGCHLDYLGLLIPGRFCNCLEDVVKDPAEEAGGAMVEDV
jgi:hypothetical protein